MQPLSTVNTNLPPSQSLSTDEIDLIGIVLLLWKEKLLIAIITAILLLPTSLWILTKDEDYAIEALIDSPSSQSINILQPSTLAGGGIYQVDPLEKNVLFQKAIQQAETQYLQKLFWETWSKKTLSDNPQESTSENDIAFTKFSKNLKVTKPDLKKTDITTCKITFTTSNHLEGVNLVNSYINFLNANTVNAAISQMETGYKSSLARLKTDYIRLKNRERERIRDQLIQLDEQFDLAKSLNIIDTPYDKLSGIELKVVDNRLYLLGTKALAEEIKALKLRQEKEPSIFVNELRNMEFWQKTIEDDLEKLHVTKGETINAFELIGPPSLLLNTPKMKLFVFLGMLFLSVIIGAIFVLIRQSIKRYNDTVIKSV